MFIDFLTYIFIFIGVSAVVFGTVAGIVYAVDHLLKTASARDHHRKRVLETLDRIEEELRNQKP